MKCFFLASSILLFLHSGIPCAGQNPTLEAADGPRFPLSRVLAKEYPLVELSLCEKQGEKLALGSTRLEVSDEIRIHGTARDGSMWSTRIGYSPAAGCGIYHGDLDGQGNQDLVLVLFNLDSSGGYDSELILLRFDEAGKPIPWCTKGLFHADKDGIAELAQDRQGNALILDTVGTGHPQWGIPDVSILYRLKNGNLDPVHGPYLGFEWPHLPKADSGNTEVRKMLGKLDLSQSLGALSAPSQKQDNPLLVFSYRDDLPKQASAPASLPAGTYPTVDLKAADASVPYLRCSDGSKSALPGILVLDRTDSSREILFDPDPSQISMLWNAPSSVRRIGTQCTATDGCQPSILWATAGTGKP